MTIASSDVINQSTNTITNHTFNDLLFTLEKQTKSQKLTYFITFIDLSLINYNDLLKAKKKTCMEC